MMQHIDSVTRAAEALLAERYGEQTHFSHRNFIVRGYTDDVVEQALMPVTRQLQHAAKQSVRLNVAA